MLDGLAMLTSGFMVASRASNSPSGPQIDADPPNQYVTPVRVARRSSGSPRSARHRSMRTRAVRRRWWNGSRCRRGPSPPPNRAPRAGDRVADDVRALHGGYPARLPERVVEADEQRDVPELGREDRVTRVTGSERRDVPMLMPFLRCLADVPFGTHESTGVVGDPGVRVEFRMPIAT